MPQAKQPVSFATLPREKLEALVADCDGWSIFTVSYLTDTYGVTPEMLGRLVTNHKSDGTPKGSITVDGKLVDSMEGVYALSLLYRIGGDLGVDTHNIFSGRGFQAQHIQRQIREHFAPAERS